MKKRGLRKSKEELLVAALGVVVLWVLSSFASFKLGRNSFCESSRALKCQSGKVRSLSLGKGSIALSGSGISRVTQIGCLSKDGDHLRSASLLVFIERNDGKFDIKSERVHVGDELEIGNSNLLVTKIESEQIEFCVDAKQEILTCENHPLCNSAGVADKSLLMISSSDPEKVVKQVYRYFDDNYDLVLDPLRKNYLFWLDEDNWKITSPSFGFDFIFPSDENALSGWIRQADSIYETVSKIFLKNGFQFDGLNSNWCKQNICELSFKKGDNDLICKLDSYRSGWFKKDGFSYQKVSFDCSDKFWDSYYDQIYYLRALNKHNFGILEKRKIGDFVWLNFDNFGMIIKLVDGEIEVLWEGQGPVTCDSLRENSIPENLYPGKCWD